MFLEQKLELIALGILLADGHRERMSIQQLSEMLERSEGSVVARLYHLGINPSGYQS